jgi:hypothetical protein
MPCARFHCFHDIVWSSKSCFIYTKISSISVFGVLRRLRSFHTTHATLPEQINTDRRPCPGWGINHPGGTRTRDRWINRQGRYPAATEAGKKKCLKQKSHHGWLIRLSSRCDIERSKLLTMRLTFYLWNINSFMSN